MAERRRERTWEEINDYSSLEEWHKNESYIPSDYKPAEPNCQACETCKFSQKRYDGKDLSGKLHPKYKSGTCEKYDTKPSKVYFDGAKCPKYEAK